MTQPRITLSELDNEGNVLRTWEEDVVVVSFGNQKHIGIVSTASELVLFDHDNTGTLTNVIGTIIGKICRPHTVNLNESKCCGRCIDGLDECTFNK